MSDDNFNGPRILSLDIETSPVVAHAWALFKQNIGINQIIEHPRTICLAAKWGHQKKVHFYSEFDHGREAMVRAIHGLLDEADIVMHYNGDRFDLPRLNTEFILAGLKPPAPYSSVDLYKIVRSRFGFQSNKLAYISEQLGLSGKIKHQGHELWIKCLAGDPKAWKEMRRYNIRDTRLLEELYAMLLPWIKSHPHVGLYTGRPNACPNCGGSSMQSRGYAYTGVGKFQRFRCNDCGTWSRAQSREFGTAVTSVK